MELFFVCLILSAYKSASGTLVYAQYYEGTE